MKDRFRFLLVSVLMILTLGFISCTAETPQPGVRLVISPVLEDGLVKDNGAKHIEPTAVSVSQYKVEIPNLKINDIYGVNDEIAFQINGNYSIDIKITALNKDGKSVGEGFYSTMLVQEYNTITASIAVKPFKAQTVIDFSVNGLTKPEADSIQFSLTKADGTTGLLEDVVRFYDPDTSALVIHAAATQGFYELIFNGADGKVAIHDSLRLIGDARYSIAIKDNKIYIDETGAVTRELSGSQYTNLNTLNYVMRDSLEWNCNGTWSTTRWFLDGSPISSASDRPDTLEYAVSNTVLRAHGKGSMSYVATRSLSSDRDGVPVVFHVVSSGKLNIRNEIVPTFNPQIPQETLIWNENYEINLNSVPESDIEASAYYWYINGKSYYQSEQKNCKDHLEFNLHELGVDSNCSEIEIEYRCNQSSYDLSLWKHTFNWTTGYTINMAPANITRWKADSITLDVNAYPEGSTLGTDKLKWTWRCTDSGNAVLATTYTTALSETVTVPTEVMMASGDYIEIDCELVTGEETIKRSIGTATGFRLINPPADFTLSVTGDDQTTIDGSTVTFNRHNGELNLLWEKPAELVDAYAYSLNALDANGRTIILSTYEDTSTLSTRNYNLEEGEYYIWIELKPEGRDHLYSSNKLKLIVGPHARSGKLKVLNPKYSGAPADSYRFEWQWIEVDNIRKNPHYEIQYLHSDGNYYAQRQEDSNNNFFVWEMTYAGSNPIARYRLAITENECEDMFIYADKEHNFGKSSISLQEPKDAYLRTDDLSVFARCTYSNSWKYFNQKAHAYDYEWKVNDTVQTSKCQDGFVYAEDGLFKITGRPIIKGHPEIVIAEESEPIICQGFDIRDENLPKYEMKIDGYLKNGDTMNFMITDQNGEPVSGEPWWFVNGKYVGRNESVYTAEVGYSNPYSVDIVAVYDDGTNHTKAYARSVGAKALSTNDAYILDMSDDQNYIIHRSKDTIKVNCLIGAGTWALYCDDTPVAENISASGLVEVNAADLGIGKHVLTLRSSDSSKKPSNRLYVNVMTDVTAELKYTGADKAYSFNISLTGMLDEHNTSMVKSDKAYVVGRSGNKYEASSCHGGTEIHMLPKEVEWIPTEDAFADYPVRVVYEVTTTDGVTATAECPLELSFSAEISPYFKDVSGQAQNVHVKAVEKNLGENFSDKAINFNWNVVGENGHTATVTSGRNVDLPLLGDSSITIQAVAKSDNVAVSTADTVSVKAMTIAENCTEINPYYPPEIIRANQENTIRFMNCKGKASFAYFKLRSQDTAVLVSGIDGMIQCPKYDETVVDILDVTVYLEGDVPGLLDRKSVFSIPVGMVAPSLNIAEDKRSTYLSNDFYFDITTDEEANLTSIELFGKIGDKDKLLWVPSDSTGYYKTFPARALEGAGSYELYLKTTNQNGSLVSKPITVEVLPPVLGAPSAYGNLIETEPIHVSFNSSFVFDRYELIENETVLMNIIPEEGSSGYVDMTLPVDKLKAGNHSVFVRCYFNNQHFDSELCSFEILTAKPLEINWCHTEKPRYTDDDQFRLSITNFQYDGTSYVLKSSDGSLNMPVNWENVDIDSLLPGNYTVFIEAVKNGHTRKSNEITLNVEPVNDPVLKSAEDFTGFYVTGDEYRDGVFTVTSEKYPDINCNYWAMEHELYIQNLGDAAGDYPMTVKYKTRAGREILSDLVLKVPYKLNFNISMSQNGQDGSSRIVVKVNGNVNKEDINGVKLIGDYQTWTLEHYEEHHGEYVDEGWYTNDNQKLAMINPITVRVTIKGVEYDFPGNVLFGDIRSAIDRKVIGYPNDDSNSKVDLTLVYDGSVVTPSDIPAGYEFEIIDYQSSGARYKFGPDGHFEWNLTDKKPGSHNLSVTLTDGKKTWSLDNGYISVFKIGEESSSCEVVSPTYSDWLGRTFNSGDSVKLSDIRYIEAEFSIPVAVKDVAKQICTVLSDNHGNIVTSTGWDSSGSTEMHTQLISYDAGDDFKLVGEVNVDIYCVLQETGEIVAKNDSFVLNIKELVPGLDCTISGGLMPSIISDYMISIAVKDFDPMGEYSWYVEDINGNQIPIEVVMWFEQDSGKDKYHVFMGKAPEISGNVKFIGKLGGKTYDEMIRIMPNPFTQRGKVTNIEGGLRYTVPDSWDVKMTMIAGESGISGLKISDEYGPMFEIMKQGVKSIDMTQFKKNQPKVCSFMGVLMDSSGHGPSKVDLIFSQFNDFEIIEEGNRYTMTSKSDPASTAEYVYEWTVDGKLLSADTASIVLDAPAKAISCKAFAVIPNLSMDNMATVRTFTAEWSKPADPAE